MDKRKNNYRDSPTAWFCLLETARQKGDREAVERAERELRRLGVHVDWREPSAPNTKGVADA